MCAGEVVYTCATAFAYEILEGTLVLAEMVVDLCEKFGYSADDIIVFTDTHVPDYEEHLN